MCHHSPECISLIHMNINHAEWQIKGQASHPDILYIEIGEFLFVPQKTKSYFDYMLSMAIRVVEFSNGEYKIRKVFA